MDNQYQPYSDYENQWKKPFEQAEMSPSKDVWDKIDTALTRQESGAYKKRFVFYRAIAAACLLCLAALSVWMVLHDHQDTSQQLSRSDQPHTTQDEALQKPQDTDASASTSASADSNIDSRQAQEPAASQMYAGETLADNFGAPKKAQHPGKASAHADNKASTAMRQTAARQPEGDAGWATNSYLPATKSSNPITDAARAHHALPAVNSERWHAMPGAFALSDRDDLMYKVPNPYAIVIPKAEKDKPVFFAGLDVSGGYFDPNFQSVSSSGQANADASPNLLESGVYDYNALSGRNNALYAAPERVAYAENTPKASFSYGMDMGVQLTRHLSVQSGLDYGRFNTATSSNLGLNSLTSGERYPVTISNISNISSDQSISYTDRTTLTSSFELLTVPLQVGYHVFFDKLQLFLSSGVAANFFLNNRISDTKGALSTLNVQAGAESIYRNVFYSGVISGGINYNVIGNYLIKIAPEYSFSITDMTKESAFISSRPFLFGMDVGIIYQFK